MLERECSALNFTLFYRAPLARWYAPSCAYGPVGGLLHAQNANTSTEIWHARAYVCISTFRGPHLSRGWFNAFSNVGTCKKPRVLPPATQQDIATCGVAPSVLYRYASQILLRLPSTACAWQFRPRSVPQATRVAVSGTRIASADPSKRLKHDWMLFGRTRGTTDYDGRAFGPA